MSLLEKLRPVRVPKQLPISFYGNPVLRKKAKPIESVTDAIRDLAARMTVTMYENEVRGIGLAAPQVGVSLRLVVIDTHDPEHGPRPGALAGELLLEPRMPMALVNPEILSFSAERDVVSEGCLSIPDISGDVERPVSLVLKTETLDGETIQVECGGLLARCLQHEMDHLDGVMFVDRMTDEDRQDVAGDLATLKRRVKRELSRGQR